MENSYIITIRTSPDERHYYTFVDLSHFPNKQFLRFFDPSVSSMYTFSNMIHRSESFDSRKNYCFDSVRVYVLMLRRCVKKGFFFRRADPYNFDLKLSSMN